MFQANLMSKECFNYYYDFVLFKEKQKAVYKVFLVTTPS